MITKTGSIKQGLENPEYKSLVWVGKPVNRASKLADYANKFVTRKVIRMMFPKPPKTLLGSYSTEWRDVEIDEFFDNLQASYQPGIVAEFKPEYHNLGFFKSLAFKR